MKELHLISGLPRSGCTELSTILNQNKDFSISSAGSLARIINSVIYDNAIDKSKNEQIIRSIIESYCDEDKVYFDKSAGWTLLTPVIKQLYPNAKIIVCVRNISDICNSFELLVRNNMLQSNQIFDGNENINVYSRCNELLKPDNAIGFAYNNLKQAYYSHESDMLHIIEYDDLRHNTEKTMRNLYKILNKEYFNHDFNNIIDKKESETYDAESVIPPDLNAQFDGMEFWRN